MPDLIPVSEAARRLGVSRERVRQLCDSGRIRTEPVVSDGRVILLLCNPTDVKREEEARGG